MVLCCLSCLLLCALPPLLWLAGAFKKMPLPPEMAGALQGSLGRADVAHGSGVRWVLEREVGHRSCDDLCAEDGGRVCAEEELQAVSSNDALELAAVLAGHSCAGSVDMEYSGMPGVCTSTACCSGNCIGSCTRGNNQGGYRERCAEKAPSYFSRLCPCRESYDDVACSSFTWWPEKDGDVACGPCKHHVAMTTFQTCRDYCASFGHACFYAASDTGRDAAAAEHGCSNHVEAACGDNMSASPHTDDMVCGCSLPRLGLAPAPAAQEEPNCSCDEPGVSADYTCEDGSHTCRAGEVCYAASPFRSADWSSGCARTASGLPPADCGSSGGGPACPHECAELRYDGSRGVITAGGPCGLQYDALGYFQCEGGQFVERQYGECGSRFCSCAAACPDLAVPSAAMRLCS